MGAHDWLRGHVWALALDSVDRYALPLEVLGGAAAVKAALETLEARTRTTSEPLATAGPVAVIPIYGVLSPRPSFWSALFGGTSYAEIRAAVQAAVADPRVKSIVLDIDSPGGAVHGAHETFAVLRQAAQLKPMQAAISGMAASAGYWLASAAPRITCTPSGDAGSVGVVGVHEDRSQYWANQGIHHTVIVAGQFKAEGADVMPLTDEARAAMQRRVDASYALFTGDVASSRGVSVADVQAGYGLGRVLAARDALEARLIDAIDPMEAVLAGEVRRASDWDRRAALAALAAELETFARE